MKRQPNFTLQKVVYDAIAKAVWNLVNAQTRDPRISWSENQALRPSFMTVELLFKVSIREQKPHNPLPARP